MTVFGMSHWGSYLYTTGISLFVLGTKHSGPNISKMKGLMKKLSEDEK